MKGLPSKRRRTSRPRRAHVQSDDGRYTKAGPVTITRADGSAEQRPPLDEEQFQRIVRRRRVPQSVRIKVMRRDRRCRYCGNETGPFEIDHRVPVSLGGSNRLSNLVLACEDCNRKKGNSIW